MIYFNCNESAIFILIVAKLQNAFSLFLHTDQCCYLVQLVVLEKECAQYEILITEGSISEPHKSLSTKLEMSL